MVNKTISILFLSLVFFSCSKRSETTTPEPPPVISTFSFNNLTVNGVNKGFTYYGLNPQPKISIFFSAPIQQSSVTQNVSLSNAGTAVPYNSSLTNGDSTLVISPSSSLNFLSKYQLSVGTGLLSQAGNKLQNVITVNLFTAPSDVDKFPRISDEALLTLVQQQTFKYFWDFGHPVSGLARERDTSGDVVTTGGSGFGIMALIVGIERQFITRADGLQRLTTMVDFLQNKADRFHGAYPHWLNGATGKVVPFSAKDDGADLVETSFLMQGLLTARQYFNGSSAAETQLRSHINAIWDAVEWSWFRKGEEEVLYWHWSPNYNWDMNLPIKGWNEALITYVLAASSPKYSIPKSVYDQGWASNGAMKNGNTYYGIQLPLGPAFGGPLFFAHYSFLGINPNGLSDVYANYATQNQAHALINFNYCKTNPKGFYGYSDSCWGLTASDDINGYLAHSPTNDDGVISPTAALSSFPYTPNESMNALKFFYYKLGDKLWKPDGFVDAFSLQDLWFADSSLAIDQGPIIVMIENYRTGLIWNLLMSCPEIKTGMRNLGFQSPHL